MVASCGNLVAICEFKLRFWTTRFGLGVKDGFDVGGFLGCATCTVIVLLGIHIRENNMWMGGATRAWCSLVIDRYIFMH